LASKFKEEKMNPSIKLILCILAAVCGTVMLFCGPIGLCFGILTLAISIKEGFRAFKKFQTTELGPTPND